VSDARAKWNDRFRAATPDFAPHPILSALPALGDTALELACGPSGTALALAAAGVRVTAIDVSDVAIAQLTAEAARRHLQIDARVDDLERDHWEAPGTYALVLATRYWDPRVFRAAARVVAVNGVLAWETFTLAEQQRRPTFSARFCLGDLEPASLLNDQFTILSVTEHDTTRRLIARRRA
jgi:2-polyprenyl-3-methyl-5-hydroxy-6-metoxy-1,4-benzoquinol methylase